jgi:dihydrofolate reductase
MREIVYLVHTSLDGCVEGPNGEFDWALMGPELSGYSRELNTRCGEFAYGRKVWDMMSSYWPDAESISDDPHDVVGGDLDAAVAELKAEPGGDLLLMGGADLAAELGSRGLIDEYLVFVHPVVLGGTKRPFAEGTTRLGLTLVESRTFDGQAVLLRYRQA